MINLKAFMGTERLFTYKVAQDGGSAPNPFHGLCTLAICKPAIRRVARKGDVIVGLGCKNDSHRIVYCMVVEASVTWENYIAGCKLGNLAEITLNKRQNLKGKIPKNENDQGDCIWKDAKVSSSPLDSWSGHGEEDFERDVINGKNVLIGTTYWYFGKGDQLQIILPDDLEKIIPYGQGHRSDANNAYREQFVDFFNNAHITTIGNLGKPTYEPGKADRQACSRCQAEERESDAHGEDFL